MIIYIHKWVQKDCDLAMMATFESTADLLERYGAHTFTSTHQIRQLTNSAHTIEELTNDIRECAEFTKKMGTDYAIKYITHTI